MSQAKADTRQADNDADNGAKKGKGVLLVDMDGTIADLDAELVARLKMREPKIDTDTAVLNRKSFEYDAKTDAIAKPIMAEPSFYLLLKPMPGAVETLKELKASGWDVFFCTSPLSEYQNCVPEKYKWVEMHFGKSWVRQIIVTKDKTLVRGDILIDDKPDITGVMKPTWRHVLFSHAYNADSKAPHISQWTVDNVIAVTAVHGNISDT